MLERAIERSLVLTRERILLRMDSGFDSQKLYVAALNAGAGRVDVLCKWNPRSLDREQCAAARRADAAAIWEAPRPGKRATIWKVPGRVLTLADGSEVSMQRIMRLTERTISATGQTLLLPEIELDGWETTLKAAPETIIQLYAEHATHEQFHSEFKTDLDLERLPSGKFDTNILVMSLAAVAYNILRLIGQQALLNEHAPPRHPAKRRRLKTVMQEMMCVAARLTTHARRLALNFSRDCPAFAVWRDLHAQWRTWVLPASAIDSG